MNKLLVLLLASATPAFAQPAPVTSTTHAFADPAAGAVPPPTPAFTESPPVASPWGSSPHVVAYQPPPKVDRAYRGLTLELALGGGTTSVDVSAGAGTFAIGGWLSPGAALAFRVTQIGAFQFVGGSLQFKATPSLWLGAGAGALSETTMDEYGFSVRENGSGSFVRGGVNLARGGAHVLYLSGEVQTGWVMGQARAIGLVALGYQFL